MSFSIVTVCRKSRISSRTLRVWEEHGLLSSSRDDNGVRTFSAEVFSAIEKIQALKECGLSLKEIGSVLNRCAVDVVSDVIRERREMLESQVLQLARAQRRLAYAEEIAGTQRNRDSILEFLFHGEGIAQKLAHNLCRGSPFSLNQRHLDYLISELQTMPPDQAMAWSASLIRIQRYAREHSIPTRFVRGYAASSMSLYAAGWTSVDPCAEGLLPPEPAKQDVHFDVPFSGCDHFFDYLSKVNSSVEDFRFIAFRLPFLDILTDFSSQTGHDPYAFVDESRLVGRLSEGDCSFVFGIDDSGDSLINRLYPELGCEMRSVEQTASDLKRFAPSSKEDVLRFLALRREKTMDIFDDWCANSLPQPPECALAAALPAGNRGCVIFREDLLAAIRRVTQWPWETAYRFRDELRGKSNSTTLSEEFDALTKDKSLEFARHWEQKHFHKAHLVSWWQHIAASLTCKLTDSVRWERCVRNWEDRNGLRWNEVGVVWREAKLLTPF